MLYDAELLEDLFDGGFVLFADVRQDEVLVACEAEISFPRQGYFQQRCLHGYFLVIQYAAALYKRRIIPEAFMVLTPSVIIDAVCEGDGTGLFQFETCSFFQLFFIPFHAILIHGVFQSCQFPVAAVAIIPLDGQDLIDGFQQLVLTGGNGYKTDDGGKAWIGFRVAMRGPESAADGDIESF